MSELEWNRHSLYSGIALKGALPPSTILEPAWDRRLERFWEMSTRDLIEVFFLCGSSAKYAHKCRRGRWWLKLPRSVKAPKGIMND